MIKIVIELEQTVVDGVPALNSKLRTFSEEPTAEEIAGKLFFAKKFEEFFEERARKGAGGHMVRQQIDGWTRLRKGTNYDK